MRGDMYEFKISIMRIHLAKNEGAERLSKWGQVFHRLLWAHAKLIDELQKRVRWQRCLDLIKVQYSPVKVPLIAR
jgi:hypothetical protein